jgi:hypothetical protein
MQKVVGLLGDILQSEVEAEVAAANDALESALEKDVQVTMVALLDQMVTGASARARAVAFIERAVMPRAAKLLNSSEETQTMIAEHLKKVMGSSVLPKEFAVFMRVLFSMNKFKNGVEGANEILDFVHASIELDKDFIASAPQVERLIMCTGSASIIYKHGGSPDKLAGYLSKKVMPKFKELSAEHQLKLLKLFADIAPFIKGASCRVCLPSMWALTLSEVPDAVDEHTKINWYIFHNSQHCLHTFLAVCGIDDKRYFAGLGLSACCTRSTSWRHACLDSSTRSRGSRFSAGNRRTEWMRITLIS